MHKVFFGHENNSFFFDFVAFLLTWVLILKTEGLLKVYCGEQRVVDVGGN